MKMRTYASCCSREASASSSCTSPTSCIMDCSWLMESRLLFMSRDSCKICLITCSLDRSCCSCSCRLSMLLSSYCSNRHSVQVKVRQRTVWTSLWASCCSSSTAAIRSTIPCFWACSASALSAFAIFVVILGQANQRQSTQRCMCSVRG